MKAEKAAGFNIIPPEVWKTRKFDNILFQLCNAVYKQNPNREMDEKLHPPLPQEKSPQNHQELQRHNSYCYRC